MKLGMLADIHEQNVRLRSALERFRQDMVDQVVVLGDAFELGERIEETVRLLRQARAIGVPLRSGARRFMARMPIDCAVLAVSSLAG